MFNFRKHKVLLSGVLIFLILGLAFTAQAGEITLSDLSGRQHKLSDYIGKPVILYFWTTWCPTCRKELKILNQRASGIIQEGIVILGVDAGEQGYRVKNFLKDYQLNMNVLLDEEMALTEQYGLIGVPTYIFLNKSGKMVAQTHRLPENYKSLLAE